jgi:hypothetical protein
MAQQSLTPRPQNFSKGESLNVSMRRSGDPQVSTQLAHHPATMAGNVIKHCALPHQTLVGPKIGDWVERVPLIVGIISCIGCTWEVANLLEDLGGEKNQVGTFLLARQRQKKTLSFAALPLTGDITRFLLQGLTKTLPPLLHLILVVHTRRPSP